METTEQQPKERDEVPGNVETSTNETTPMPVAESETNSKNEEAPKTEKENDTESDSDAVLAVVAAVELAQKSSNDGSAVVSTKAASTTPAKRKQSRNSTGASGLNDMGSPSCQKRRKKDPSAPKAPLNGYLVYFNEERAGMRAQNPNIGFGELTKIIAAKWKELPTEAKQKYINEADQDKERYEKEMACYKKSDAYKQFLKGFISIFLAHILLFPQY